MSGTALLKGQRVTTPEGKGEIVEITGEKVVVKLDTGTTATYSINDVTDDSSAG